MSTHNQSLTLDALGRVHFIGLGGAGMSAVARIMLARGVPVSGSDSRDSPLLRSLERLGATVYVGQLERNVQDADTVVISTAIRSTNPELAEASRRSLRILHRSQALAATMTGQRVIAIAGTHGKTTTTAMTTVMLQAAGVDPSFAIGGDVSSLGVNAAFGAGGLFVAEADESDASFLNYTPSIAVVTNVEADHLDHYGTAEAVHAVFDTFVTRLDSDGLLVACADDAGSAALAERAGARRVRTYGYSAEADVRISGTTASGTTSVSTLTYQQDGQEKRQELKLGVPGEHNIRNAAAAFTVALELGLDAVRSADGLGAFSGAARRFEFKGEARSVRVYDDYAHHPTEVRAALQAARSVAGSGSAVHVLFQPHLFSRTLEFAQEFADALELADSVAVLDIYPAREDPIPGVTSTLITSRLNDQGSYYADPQRALASVVSRASPGDVVLTVGAGDVTAYGAELVGLLGNPRVPENGR